jgi:hypothetical protein
VQPLIFLTPNYAKATHSVSASPPGGTYDSPKSVALESTAAGVIYYTLDGSTPTNSSAEYTVPIAINEDTTLNFVAIDNLDGHSSLVFSETYVIDNSSPEVVSTTPTDGATRVDPRSSSFNAVFSEPMDESTINVDTIGVKDAAGNTISGSVSYDPDNFTATFTADEEFSDGCDQCFKIGRLYTAIVSSNVTDADGNQMQADFSFSFRTGGSITVNVIDIVNSEFLGGSAVEINPDPFDLTGALIVEDDSEQDLDVLLFEEQIPGTIVLFNVEFGSYALNEITPEGYISLYENVIVTVHDTNRRATMAFRNIPDTSTLDEVPPVLVPSPNLNEEQFELYQDNATRGIFSGIKGTELGNRSPISTVGPNAIPESRLTSHARFQEIFFAIESIVFNLTAPASSTGQELFEFFLIPTYPNPTEDVADGATYVAPAFVIPYSTSNNNFVLTPVIGRVFPGMTLTLLQASFVEAEVAKVERLNMTFNVEGNNVGFSFGISDSPPPGTPDPDLDATALFLDVGFVGDVDFSNPSAFQSSPKIDILVNKTLPGFPELPNGCPDFRLLFFNGEEWEEVQKLNPTGNFTDFCPFTLEPEHFSKFAVGGVKGQTISTESSDDERSRGGGGGGGSRSSSITQPLAGDDVESTIKTNSGTVVVQFESIDEGSGQLRINSNELSSFEEFFDDIAFLQDNDEHGIIRTDGLAYATAGDVFDIDASGVWFTGTVDVTVPYDEKAVMFFGSESEVKFLHYNAATMSWEEMTSSVNEEANTVTGTLDSLSPVTAGIMISKVEDDSPTRVQLADPILTVTGTNQLTLSTDLAGEQKITQEYVFLVQVVDERNVAQYIEWQKGTLSASQVSPVSVSWSAMEKGRYTVTVVVISDMENPVMLSEAIHKDLTI